MWFNTWHLSVGYRPFVDFCVWVLEVDGLRAGPFDRHPEGNGRLREAGLDSAGWEIWFSDVVATLDAREKTFRAQFTRPTVYRQQRQRLDALKWWTASMPARLWIGPPAVRHELEAMWEPFVFVAPNRRLISPGNIERTRPTGRWKWMKSYRNRIPSPFQAYYVAYPEQVDHIEPPSSVVLSLRRGEVADEAALRERIKQSADSLAAADQAIASAIATISAR
jgi:hypothetical protein